MSHSIQFSQPVKHLREDFQSRNWLVVEDIWITGKERSGLFDNINDSSCAEIACS